MTPVFTWAAKDAIDGTLKCFSPEYQIDNPGTVIISKK
jgi:hypothetical protein